MDSTKQRWYFLANESQLRAFAGDLIRSEIQIRRLPGADRVRDKALRIVPYGQMHPEYGSMCPAVDVTTWRSSRVDVSIRHVHRFNDCYEVDLREEQVRILFDHFKPEVRSPESEFPHLLKFYRDSSPCIDWDQYEEDIQDFSWATGWEQRVQEQKS